MNIQQSLLVSLLVVNLFIIGCTTLGLYESFHKKKVYEFSKESSRSIDSLLKSTGHWAVERGVTHSSLNSSTIVDNEMIGTIAQRRKNGDAAYNKAIKQIQSYGFKGKDEFLTKLKKAYSQVLEMRKKVDRNIILPKIKRDTSLITSWMPTISELIILSQDLRFVINMNSTTIDAELGRQSELKHFSWIMSEYAGRERAIIGGAISANSSIDKNQLAQLSNFRGKVEAGWGVVKKLAIESNDEVKENVANIEKSFFGEFQKLRTSIYDSAINGNAYPIDAQGWIDQSTKAINSILVTQDVYNAETEFYVEELIKIESKNITRNIIILVSCLVFGALLLYLISYISNILKVFSIVSKDSTFFKDSNIEKKKLKQL